MAPRVRVREVGIYTRRVRTRIPFRYGQAVVTEEPVAHVRAVVEGPAGVVTGVSAAALPPLWFDKDVSRTHADQIRDLLRSVRVASDLTLASAPADAWELHRSVEPEARRRLAGVGLNELTSGFGVALMDAAVIDAVCRQAGRTFHQGLREDLFGLGADFARLVPPQPLSRIFVRHTIGMADPIRAVEARERIGDGLPETLEEVIREYRVRFFKVKISSDTGATLERLLRIAAVLDRLAGDYRLTLDGNEQFHTMEEAERFILTLALNPAFSQLWERTLWIEQPVERSAALEDAVKGSLWRIRKLKPVIIDESDGTDEVVDRALSLGYSGISAKNCKGIFRTLHSYRRVLEAQALLASEDLMNIPVVPLQQDLCVAAALGIPHSERNGHHYIRAFEYLSPSERENALREFPSFYRARPEGCPVVRIEDGTMSLAEINSYALGVRSEPDWSSLDMIK